MCWNIIQYLPFTATVFHNFDSYKILKKLYIFMQAGFGLHTHTESPIPLLDYILPISLLLEDFKVLRKIIYY